MMKEEHNCHVVGVQQQGGMETQATGGTTVSSTGETRKNQSIGDMADNSGFLEGRQNQRAAAMACTDKLRKAGEAQKSSRNKEQLGKVFADPREKMLSPAQRVQRVQRELALAARSTPAKERS